MRHFILALVLLAAPALSAQAVNTWVGVGAGADKHLMVNLGFTTNRSGFTQWGGEIGYVGTNNTDQQAPENIKLAPGETRETDFSGLQVGAFADWGRAFVVVGAERVQKSTITSVATTVHGSPVTNTKVEDSTKFGGYVKAGIRFTQHLSFYVAVGSQSKVYGGIGIHF